MVKLKKSALIKVAVVFASIGLLTIVAAWLLKLDDERVKGYEIEATAVGLAKIKEECRKEGVGPNVCGHLVVFEDTTRCYDRVCWLVSARSTGTEFGANVTVIDQSGQYIATDYARSLDLSPLN